MKCRLCSFVGTDNFRTAHSTCIFDNSEITRYICPRCDVVFGPLYMLDLSLDDLLTQYVELYKNYSEGDSTNLELRIFKDFLKPRKEGKYLNFGSGKNRTLDVLRSEGYTVYGYDPAVSSEATLSDGDLERMKFDGVFSNNVIEHLQKPVDTTKFLLSTLNSSGVLAHGSDCYGYTTHFSRFHLYLFAGRSVNVLAELSGAHITHREQNLVVFQRGAL